MGQAKRRGTYEERVALKQKKYNNLPLVNLHRIGSNSSDRIKNKFIEYNVDYLSQLDSKLKLNVISDTKLELEQYTIKKHRHQYYALDDAISAAMLLATYPSQL